MIHHTKYVGPEGYGCGPESGGDTDIGKNRMQSEYRFKERLTAEVKVRITKEFAGYGLEVRKIEKMQPSGRLRVAYNGEAWK